MRAGSRSVNYVGVGCANPEEAKFESLYCEKVNFLDNQGGSYHLNYPRHGGNQGGIRIEVGKIMTENGETKIQIRKTGRMIGM